MHCNLRPPDAEPVVLGCFEPNLYCACHKSLLDFNYFAPFPNASGFYRRLVSRPNFAFFDPPVKIREGVVDDDNDDDDDDDDELSE